MKRLDRIEGADRYGKFILWGLASNPDYDLHHIESHFADCFRQYGLPYVFVDDHPDNASVVEPGDWLFSTDIADHHLPVVEGVDYVLHNAWRDYVHEIDFSRRLMVQVYTNACTTYEQWSPTTHFDRDGHCLYQPWGVDLFPDQFLDPVDPHDSATIYWVGSVWNNDENQGNITVIDELQRVLAERGLGFEVIRHVPDDENRRFVRASRLAPALGGEWQVEHNYLPCRVFKNAAYGQVAFTNVPKFADILGDALLPGDTIEALVTNALELSASDYQERCRAQQACIQDQSYDRKLENILHALELIR